MKAIDLTGQKFALLTVIKRVANDPHGGTVWECQCACGNKTVVRSNNLKSGVVKSCGCLKHRPTRTHNMSNTKLYRVWATMKARCNNPKSKSYKDYGNRGIKLCDEWNNSFQTFAEWALQNGYKEGLTIERINVNRDYSPKNCTWVPKNSQAQNRRTCIMFEHNGERKNLMAWSHELGIPYKLLHNRVNKLGWSFDRAISESVHVEKRNRKDDLK